MIPGKIPVVSLEDNEKKLNPSSEIIAREDVKPECSGFLGKKPVELREENEKKSSLSPEVTVHEDLKLEHMDLVGLPLSSFIFKFRLPSNDNSWLVSTT